MKRKAGRKKTRKGNGWGGKLERGEGAFDLRDRLKSYNISLEHLFIFT